MLEQRHRSVVVSDKGHGKPEFGGLPSLETQLSEEILEKHLQSKRR